MLAQDTVRDILTALKRGIRQREIAEKFHISRSLVSDIATGRAYKNVPREQTTPEEDRIKSLEAEVIHLREEKKQALKAVKEENRRYGLFQAMVSELEDRIAPLAPRDPQIRSAQSGQIEEHCVLHLSDAHHDEVLEPSQCGGLEHHDFNVSCVRAERLVDTTIQWTQEVLAPRFYFPALTILAYGDFTNGEIHGSAGRSHFKKMMRNCLAIGNLHASMFRDLAAHFNQVNVVYVPGNHGRRTRKKDYHGAHDNWDYLIAEIARLCCSDIGNVDFLIPNSFSVNLDINGIGFSISHGDEVRSHQGIPWYGLQRRQKRLQSLGQLQNGPRTRYHCLGHFHQKAMVGELDGEMIMNGPWIGTSVYAYESLAAYTEPFQWLHGVNSKYGITWRMDVRLRDTERERRGPERYHITME